MIFEQKNFHECNTFILRELSKRLEDNNSERFESLNAIQQELKRHREELFTQKEDREPPESCLQDEPSFSHSAAKTAQKQPQTDAAGAVPKPIEASEPDKGLTERKSGMVKNVCTLFESIAIDNFNSIARKMKVRGSKKKRG